MIKLYFIISMYNICVYKILIYMLLCILNRVTNYDTNIYNNIINLS